MHTFFVNTSAGNPLHYDDLFEIARETRQFVSLDCPLAEWNTEAGYLSCVRTMGEQIDSYKDINNDFNLIFYVDLRSYEQYAAAETERERYARLKVLRMLLRQYIAATFVAELDEIARKPREILLIFEENPLPQDRDEYTDSGKRLLRDYTRRLLGLCEAERLQTRLERVVGKLSPQEREACLKSEEPTALAQELLRLQMKHVELFYEEHANNGVISTLFESLLQRVIDGAEKESEGILTVSFAVNSHAVAANKSERARRDLSLCFYLLSCVRDGKLTAPSGEARQFSKIDWQRVIALLSQKKKAYNQNYTDTKNLAESFSTLKLAPELKRLPFERFALDEFGNPLTTLHVIDADAEKDDGKKDKKKASAEDADAVEMLVRPQGEKAVETEIKRAHPILSKKDFEPFDYDAEEELPKDLLRKKVPPEDYIEAARILRDHRLKYLHRLSEHVSDRLSNYAGRSPENHPPILPKRRVSMADEDFESEAAINPSLTPETRKLETVEGISKTACTSALLNYMQFCAQRSVAIADIEEQCNWFVTRVNQISHSLRKLKTVAIGLAVALVVLYIPFVALQWEAIAENMRTISIALCSFAVPLAVGYAVFAVASSRQRRKYRLAWKKFKETVDEIHSENIRAAKEYDLLLTAYIPAVRRLYEYRLDVEFYGACCKMARAKVAHHLKKLGDRLQTVGNIIEDLELAAPGVGGTNSHRNEKPDYNASFCSGDVNRNFYSVIDDSFLDSLAQQ